MNFSGKNVIVTGGGNGIGWEIVHHLLSENVTNLAIIDLNDKTDEIDILKSTLTKKQSLKYYKIDVSNRASLEIYYKIIFDEMSNQLDCVINAAGIFNENEIERTLIVNLGGVINSSLSAMKLMSKENFGNGGIICNIASSAAIDDQLAFIPIYAATKAGIVNFTRSMSRDIFYEKSGVKFISVCPTATNTDMFTQLHKKLLFPNIIQNSYKIMEQFKKQNTKEVAKCIINAIENFQNGVTYLIENEELITVELKYQRLTK